MKSMRIVTRIAAIIVATASAIAHAEGGQGVGNGGDAVFCRPAPSINKLKGHYVLDYVLAKGPLQPFKDSDEALSAIVAQLKETDQGQSNLEDFIEGTKSPSWRPTKNGVFDLDDSRLDELPPRNCVGKNPGSLELFQLVRRESSGESEAFLYDEELMKKIRLNGDQYSWIIVHEWLWSYLNDARDVRAANEFLHSPAFFAAKRDSKVLANLLRKLGGNRLPLLQPGMYLSNFYSKRERDPQDCKILVTADPRNHTIQITQSPERYKDKGCDLIFPKLDGTHPCMYEPARRKRQLVCKIPQGDYQPEVSLWITSENTFEFPTGSWPYKAAFFHE